MMKIEKASKQSDESILAFTKEDVQLMSEVEYENVKYLVVSYSQSRIPGLPNQITAFPKSKFSEDYKK